MRLYVVDDKHKVTSGMFAARSEGFNIKEQEAEITMSDEQAMALLRVLAKTLLGIKIDRS